MIGLLEPMKTSSLPVLLQLSAPVIKIVSGEQGPGVCMGQAGARGCCNCREKVKVQKVHVLFLPLGCSEPGTRVCLLFSGF